MNRKDLSQLETPRIARVRAENIQESDVDAQRLASELASQISGEVRFDSGSRALYATDASNYRQIPIGVVVPKDVEDVIQTVALCRKYGAPVLPRGGGTSLGGSMLQCGCRDRYVQIPARCYRT